MKIYFILISLFFLVNPVEAFGPFTKKEEKQINDITLPHLGKGASALQDFKGKIVLVHLWATWCGSCAREMPSLKRFNDRITKANQPLELLMVSTDFNSSEAVKNYAKENGIDGMKHFHNPTAGSSLGVKGIPTTIIAVVDGDGNATELGRIVGPADWNSSSMTEMLDNLMSKHLG